MKLHIISAALPPKLDGIGDYTAYLAAELARSLDVTVLTGMPDPAPIPGVRVETAFSADEPRSVWQLVDRVVQEKPDWVLLQYNPFAYGRWGLNLHLPRVMRRIKQVSPGTRFALMVHEPFVPIISPQFAVMASWQRWQLWSLGQCADQVFFSIDPWAKRFQKWFPRTVVSHLPVGSNIPLVPIEKSEARARLGIPDDTLVLGLFGTASSGRLLDRVRDAATALQQAGHTVQLLYIGPHKDQICASLRSLDIIADGPASPEEVSRRFAAMDIYLAAYTDGISTRRGALMAALQHGIATAGTRGPLTDDLLLREDGQAFLLADTSDFSQFSTHVVNLADNPVYRDKIGDAGRQLYEQEFDWTNLAKNLCDILSPQKI